jgi:hypothetical protein
MLWKRNYSILKTFHWETFQAELSLNETSCRETENRLQSLGWKVEGKGARLLLMNFAYYSTLLVIA